MYKFSKKARWLCIILSMVRFLKKRLILLPKNTNFIKDRFYSICSCDLLWHRSTEQWPLLKSEKSEGQGNGNGEQVFVVSRIQSFTTRRYGWVEAFCVILPLLCAWPTS